MSAIRSDLCEHATNRLFRLFAAFRKRLGCLGAARFAQCECKGLLTISKVLEVNVLETGESLGWAAVGFLVDVIAHCDNQLHSRVYLPLLSQVRLVRNYHSVVQSVRIVQEPGDQVDEFWVL